MKNCEECNKPFEVILDRHKRVQRFCSIECRNKTHYKYVLNWRKSSVAKTLMVITGGCKSRAKKSRLECDIDTKYTLELLKKQNGLCAGTGLELRPAAGRGKSGKDPFTVSIDRRDPSKGYTRDNIQLVCVIYNEAKNSYRHEDVVMMARSIVKKEG